MDNKLYISFSLLDLWIRGKIDDAVALYFHLEEKTTPQMEAGKELHKKFQEAIDNHKRLVFKEDKFTFINPKTEMKLRVQYNNRWYLSGVIDCYDDKTIYEFKTGETSINNYLSSFQIPFYFLLLDKSNLEYEKAILIHYDQYHKKSEWLMFWKSNKAIKEVSNLIDSVAPEIEDFFVKNSLFEKYEKI